MKKLVAQVLIFIQFLCITQAVLGQKVLKVFLMGGQSNMVGNGDNNVLPTELQQHRSDIHIYVFGTANYNWGPLMPGLGSVPAAHGAELAFGYDIKAAFPTANIAIIKGAWSGTSLYADWRPPSSGGTTGNLFNTFINNVKAGLAQKVQEGYTIQLAGMCWMQGESDGMNATECQNYQTNLKNFINDVRSKLNAPDMPFVIGKVMLNASYPYDNTIRTAEDQVAASVPNVGIFDTDGLTVANAHFSIDGCIGLGHRFANTMIPRVTVNTPRAPFKATIPIPGIVEAEDFDSGGQNLTYYDTDPANNGAQYRTTESVDIEICTEGGYDVGWIASGEWMEYTVNVATTGNYQVSCRVAGPNDNTQFHIAFDGVDKTGIIIVNKTTGFQNWTSINKTIPLTAGLHTMRFFVDQTSGFNLNNFTFTSAGAPALGTGTGLTGNYYNDGYAFNLNTWTSSPTETGAWNPPSGISWFSSLAGTRTDATINVARGSLETFLSGVPNLNKQGPVSVRWTGSVEFLYEGTYTFYLSGADGLRLNINRQNVIGTFASADPAWVVRAYLEKNSNFPPLSGTINVTTGMAKTKIPVTLEFFSAGATQWSQLADRGLKLEWESTVQARGIVPQSQLYPQSIVTSYNSQVEFEKVIRIYPNPVTGEKFYVQLPDYNQEVNWQILNPLGDIISSGKLNSGNRSGIPTPSTDGLYFLNLKGKDFMFFNKLIVAQ